MKPSMGYTWHGEEAPIFIRRSRYVEIRGIREHDVDAFKASDLHRRGTTRPDFSSLLGMTWNALERSIVRSVEAPSDDGEEPWKNSTIAARSSRDHGSFVVEAKPRSLRTIPDENGKRNVHDRCPIAS